MKYCIAFLVNLFRINEDLIRIINCERGRRERTNSSFYKHTWNRLQRIKSVKMVVETSDKNQCCYFYVLNPFVKFRSRKHIAQLLNATHLLEAEQCYYINSLYFYYYNINIPLLYVFIFIYNIHIPLLYIYIHLNIQIITFILKFKKSFPKNEWA